MQSFGQRLKDLRREAGFSQSDLSERIGVSIQSISKWENDNTMPDISQIVPLAAVLGVSTDWLLGVGMNEEADLEILRNRIEEITAGYSTNTYKENAELLAYEAGREFMKKYPLNSVVRLECAHHLYNYLKRSRDNYFAIPEDEFAELHAAGVKNLNALISQEKDPGRQIEARRALIDFLKLTMEWDAAEKIAMELPDSYEIRDEALLDIACEKRDFKSAEALSARVSKRRAYEYLNSMFLRARRISIYGTVRKKEAIAAWRQMVEEAKHIAQIYGGEVLDFNEIVDQFLIKAITSESNDHLAISDVESALNCVEEATEVIEKAYDRFKKSGAGKDDLERYRSDCRWVPIMCYGWVIPNDDNILSREPRFKACQQRIEALA